MIEAVIHNARRAGDLVEAEGSLAAFFWRFEDRDQDAPPQSRSTSPASSRELRKRGWKFFGPTTVHAFTQAMGLCNDPAEGSVNTAGRQRGPAPKFASADRPTGDMAQQRTYD